MGKFKTSFMGLTLQSPIIVGSSGLTHSLEKMRQMVDAGAGAIILKSLFEEQIEAESHAMQGQNSDVAEMNDYIAHYIRAQEVEKYLERIRNYKKELSVPIIGSINCLKADSWVDFAVQIQEAGADAIELNIMRLETDLFFDPIAGVKSYMDIVSRLSRLVQIPIIVKLSRYHTALPSLVDKLRASGAKAVTLFNRSYQPDINLDKEEYSSGDVFTHAGDFADSLRFTALVDAIVPQIGISTSSGIYSWAEVTKSLLVGADTVQMCTILYKEGASAISNALSGLGMWMDKHGYLSIDEFRGRLNASSHEEENLFERTQFMKYFGSVKG